MATKLKLYGQFLSMWLRGVYFIYREKVRAYVPDIKDCVTSTELQIRASFPGQCPWQRRHLGIKSSCSFFLYQLIWPFVGPRVTLSKELRTHVLSYSPPLYIRKNLKFKSAVWVVIILFFCLFFILFFLYFTSATFFF